MEEFDYKKFLVENRLTPNSRLLRENNNNTPIPDVNGIVNDVQSLATKALEDFDLVSNNADEIGVEDGEVDETHQSIDFAGITAFIVPKGGYPEWGNFKQTFASETNDGEYVEGRAWWKRYPQEGYDIIFFV